MLRSVGLSPKFHGAYLGAGTGTTIAAIVIGLIQTYGTHKTLPAVAVQGIYTVVSIVLAAYGAWVAPPGQVTSSPATAPLALPAGTYNTGTVTMGAAVTGSGGAAG